MARSTKAQRAQAVKPATADVAREKLLGLGLVQPLTPQVAQAILEFLGRAPIKGAESEAMLQCRAEVLRVTARGQGQMQPAIPTPPSGPSDGQETD